ncbi:Palmitoyltransferase ZDHHC17 [Ananas comosus]|uniref:S-acyltransferase n=1 Tax=Ananas comosus TaxID=4615 RepID=A0A199V5L0_ANACO|nr:Palmitoyltransferase ZDHHC17 [Ananas comosus]
MVGSGFQRLRKSPWEILSSAIFSSILVVSSQLALAMVPHFFPSFSLVSMLPIAGVVFVATVVIGRWCRRLLGVPASAPAFVLFNVFFLWGVYICIIRQAVPSLLDAILNAECALLLFGLYRIFSSDPGMVSYDSSRSTEASCNGFSDFSQCENSSLFPRVRYCTSCKTNIRGFDHHCPALGNCIGQKNHRLFMVLLTGFVIAESSYTMCSTRYITRFLNTSRVGLEANLSLNMVISTMLFSILQVLWQVVFLMWHLYCICFNIKTEEWINWRKYPEFQLNIPAPAQQGSALSEIRFFNPYDKGFVGNIKEFLKPKH